jgi:hypothetical protein
LLMKKKKSQEKYIREVTHCLEKCIVGELHAIYIYRDLKFFFSTHQTVTPKTTLSLYLCALVLKYCEM